MSDHKFQDFNIFVYCLSCKYLPFYDKIVNKIENYYFIILIKIKLFSLKRSGMF